MPAGDLDDPPINVIVAVAVAETLPATSWYCAQTVFVPRPVGRVTGAVVASDVVLVQDPATAVEQSLPLATR